MGNVFYFVTIIVFQVGDFYSAPRRSRQKNIWVNALHPVCVALDNGSVVESTRVLLRQATACDAFYRTRIVRPGASSSSLGGVFDFFTRATYVKYDRVKTYIIHGSLKYFFIVSLENLSISASRSDRWRPAKCIKKLPFVQAFFPPKPIPLFRSQTATTCGSFIFALPHGSGYSRVHPWGCVVLWPTRSRIFI